MTSDWFGGGLIMAVAAGLWLIYFMPAFTRRSQYLATERNAVRLQQTLRILAETAEVPDEIRAETTARSVAEHQRYLKKTTLTHVPAAVLAAARIRRARGLTSSFLLVSLVVAGLAGLQYALPGALLIAAVGAVCAVSCLVVLVSLAKAGRGIRLPAPQNDSGSAFVDHSASFDAQVGLEASGQPMALVVSSWLPTPLPKPLYASRVIIPGLAGTSPAVAREVSLDIEAEVRRAALDAERGVRAAVVAAESASETLAAVSPFASMGIIDSEAGADGAAIDIDAVLARRRAG
jgi:hypothetical protein